MEPFNPLRPGFLEDPYPFYHRFRSHDPVHCAVAPTPGRPGFWYLFRHADVAATLKDPRFGRELHRVSPLAVAPVLPETHRAFYEMAGKWMLYRDPPDHTRLRTLVSKAFTPSVVAGLRPRITSVTNALLDAAEDKGGMDIIADFAFPLPLVIIAELLGVPAEDQVQFRAWSNALSAAIDQNRTPQVYEEASRATVALHDYFLDILEERRRHPRNDLISRLSEAEEQGGHLTEEEIVATCILLLGAGQETTVDLIGNSVVALLRHPAQLQYLRENLDAMPAAIEEFLRYDGPVQMTARVALEDVNMGGKTIRQGAKVTMVLGAANRDPEVFANPDCLDLQRNPKMHMAFGVGIHFCLGGILARSAGQIALGALLQRFPDLSLAVEEPCSREGIVFRGYESIPVSWNRVPCLT